MYRKCDFLYIDGSVCIEKDTKWVLVIAKCTRYSVFGYKLFCFRVI